MKSPKAEWEKVLFTLKRAEYDESIERQIEINRDLRLITDTNMDLEPARQRGKQLRNLNLVKSFAKSLLE